MDVVSHRTWVSRLQHQHCARGCSPNLLKDSGRFVSSSRWLGHAFNQVPVCFFLISYTHTYLITGCADLQTTAFRWRRITQSLPDGKKTVLNPGKTTWLPSSPLGSRSRKCFQTDERNQVTHGHVHKAFKNHKIKKCWQHVTVTSGLDFEVNWSLEWSIYYPVTCIQLLTILGLWMMKLCATQKYLVFFLCYGLRMARNAINGAIRPRALGWPNRIPGISGSSSIQVIRGTGPGLLGPQISIKNSTDLRVASVGCNSRRMFANAK